MSNGQQLTKPKELDIVPEENIIDYLRKDKSSNKYAVKYKAFATALLSPKIKNSLLISWLKQFKDNIMFLEKENGEIMNYLLRLDWVHKSSEVVSLYQELILNVVSAHPYYLRSVLEMLIKLFSTGDDGTDYVTEKEKELFSKGHHLIKEITALVPTSPSLLCNVIVKNYPYLKKDVHVHVCYFTNVLEMCTYLPAHHQIIMEDLTIKLLQMDALCPRNQIEEDELENCVDEKSFPMDHDGTDAPGEQDRMVNPLANTLDVIMDSLFQYTRRVCFSKDGKVFNWEATKKFFKEILALFDKVILPTHGSVHTQFILFYLCSLKPDLQEAYIDYLWKKVQNPNTPATLRQAAMFYIGSFLARASYVTVGTVAVCFDLFCHWIHQYIDTQCYRNYADISAHGTFYAVCQAVFYVFAFRHKELIEMKNGLKILQNLNFERIIMCRLNPLKVCLPAIVQNFASVTRSYQLAYCYTVIEKNNRNLISRVVQSSNGTTEAVKLTVLHTLFPFDPYLLKRSKKWIEPMYRVYDPEDSEPMDDEEEDCILGEQSYCSPRKSSFTKYGSSLSTRPLFSPARS